MQVADEAAMSVALAEAESAAHEKEVPVGAVIVCDGQVVSRNHNRVLQTGDPTAHAELLTIQHATSLLGLRGLMGCTLYVTLEPCAMCAGALVLARISRLVFGASDAKTGACGSLRNIVEDRRLNHRMVVQRGVMEWECRELLLVFFQTLRQKNKKQQGCK